VSLVGAILGGIDAIWALSLAIALARQRDHLQRLDALLREIYRDRAR
jgi:hypothetical protein